MKWEDIKARSLGEIKLGDRDCFCFDCYMNFHFVEMPCAKHCLSDEERSLREAAYNKLQQDYLSDPIPPSPFLDTIKKS